jgi:hypothetical protein
VNHELEQLRNEPKTPWSPTLAELDASMPKSGLFRTWTERYNAACLFALPLMVTSVNDDAKTTAQAKSFPSAQ